MFKFYTSMKRETGVEEALTDEVADVILKYTMRRLYPTSMTGIE